MKFGLGISTKGVEVEIDGLKIIDGDFLHTGEYRSGILSCLPPKLTRCLTTCFVPCLPFHFIMQHLKRRGLWFDSCDGWAWLYSILFTLAVLVLYTVNVFTYLGFLPYVQDYKKNVMGLSDSMDTYLKYASMGAPLVLIGLTFYMRRVVGFARGIKERNFLCDAVLAVFCSPCLICQAADEFSGHDGERFYEGPYFDDLNCASSV